MRLSASILVPHRAVYDLKLGDAKMSSGVEALDGRMVMEWADACDGYTLTQRIQTRIYSSDGDPTVTDFRITTWESKDGKSFRFAARQTTNDQVTEDYKGSAVLKDDGSGLVSYTQPSNGQLELGKGTLFPTQHTLALIEAAQAGKHLLSKRVFDGSGPDVSYEAVAALGKPIAADVTLPQGKGVEMLKGQPSWPMQLAYFPLVTTDGVPEYEIGFRMFQNGISTNLVLNYGDFSVNGVLNELQTLPEPGC
ncbi:cell envelope integrity EipB family protein [Zavarzinia sp. CC-PAN008]|uniref:cell envelope integrity EipB family protein n=1 Tax=Zavarzinia sp. CC-PAN008 TaxID=3243332 RepID=UPI003F749FC4